LYQGEEKKGRHPPAFLRYMGDFMLRQDAGRFMLGMHLSDKKIPWQQRRHD